MLHDPSEKIQHHREKILSIDSPRKNHTVIDMNSLRLFLACCLLIAPWAHAQEASKLSITLDVSKAPQCQAFADKAKTIAEEWYPKIHNLLFDKTRELPKKSITMIFEPMDGVAYARGNEIHFSADWIKKSPEDYGMVVHELVHIVQDYKGKGEFWLTEGLADYVRYSHFEPGKNNSWQLDPARSSYKQGYGIAGSFLDWIDQKKTPGKDLIRKLNTACHDGTYQANTIETICGATVDAMWKEYITEKTAKPKN